MLAEVRTYRTQDVVAQECADVHQFLLGDSVPHAWVGARRELGVLVEPLFCVLRGGAVDHEVILVAAPEERRRRL